MDEILSMLVKPNDMLLLEIRDMKRKTPLKDTVSVHFLLLLVLVGWFPKHFTSQMQIEEKNQSRSLYLICKIEVFSGFSQN